MKANAKLNAIVGTYYVSNEWCVVEEDDEASGNTEEEKKNAKLFIMHKQ